MERTKQDPTTGNVRQLVKRPAVEPAVSRPEQPELGDVVRDAMDHAKVIARDTAAIGKLEAQKALEKARLQARRVLDDAKETVAEVGPKIAFGVIASLFASVGVVLGFIALFMALGAWIPSVAARLGVFAGAFLLLAGITGAFAARRRRARKLQVTTTTTSETIASAHPDRAP